MTLKKNFQYVLSLAIILTSLASLTNNTGIGLQRVQAFAPTTDAGGLITTDTTRDLAGSRQSAALPVRATNSITATVAYTITDLGPLVPRVINDHGQVLGFVNPQNKLWLPEPAYGMPAGLNDLNFPNLTGISDINNAGTMSGGIWDPNLDCSDGLRAATWQWNEGTQQFDTLLLPTSGGWEEASATALNNAGFVVGRAECHETDGDVAARWQNGLMTSLGTLGGEDSLATAINEAGQIVGDAETGGASPERHAFLWSGGGMTDLGTLPGDLESRAVDINDEGQVIGSSGDKPFLWLPAPAYGLPIGMHSLPDFNFDPSPGQVYGINNQGQVVGYVNLAGGQQNAYLWDQGTPYDLNDLIDPASGWDLVRATGINENGQIAGFGTYEGTQHGFLLTPISSWTVMFYLDGDNNLAGTYPPILNQLELAADNPNVHVIAYHDDLGFPGTDYYEIQHDLDPYNLATYTFGENWWPQGERDTGLSVTLSDFVIWAIENYPADNYALVLDNHGSGLAGGLVDETSSSDMNLIEMEAALATIYDETSEKIDVLYMAMCLMGMLEDAYQFREYVDYYVANENLQWAYTEPYSEYVAGIDGNSSPAQVAVNFAQAYADVAHVVGQPYTISTVDLAQLDPLVIATNSLGAALDANMTVISETLDTVTDDVQRFDNKPTTNMITLNDTYIDLYDFASRVSVSMSGYADIFSASEAVKTALNNYVIFESHGHSTADVNVDNSHGVSIFFPASASSFYNPENYDFAVGANWSSARMLAENVNSGTWGAMLVSYFQATQPGGPDDPYPPEPLPKLDPYAHRLFLPLAIQ